MVHGVAETEKREKAEKVSVFLLVSLRRKKKMLKGWKHNHWTFQEFSMGLRSRVKSIVVSFCHCDILS